MMQLIAALLGAEEFVQHERLMRFRQAQLPRDARVLDAGLRRRAGAAVVTADEHHVRVRLGDARRNRADAHLSHELDADARVMVRVLEVVNQLSQVFNRVDVVVRRRGNQSHARRRVADLGDPGVNLLPGQLAAFAGLRALRHFDLQLPRLHEILAGDAKAARSDLFDAAVL